MKKLFVLAAVIILTFTACETETEPDYGEIGKKGPGGGRIFFAEGNQYMECSGELGDNTWAAAITTANNYRGGGFSDWHLPTRNELDLMYKNLKKNDLGGFSSSFYWTSAEYNSSYAYYQDFYNGSKDWHYKSNSYHVRAVRTYSKNTNTNSTTLIIKNESSVEIADAIWQGVSFAPSQTNSTITSGSLVTKTVQPGSGYIFFTRKTNPINARTSELVVIEKDKQKEFVFTNNTLIVDVDNPDNTGTLGTLQPLLTTLKIKNESFAEITDVIWQSVSFANNLYENSIKSGTTVTKTVQPGGGYIFFKRKANPIFARTNDIVIVEKNDDIEFIFTDNTSIVEVNNPDNNGTLGALQSTVVWWDDAEGEMQPYYEARSFVGYYSNNAGLPSKSSAYSNVYYTPKNGNKSIVIGGTTTAMLHLKINLTKNAKLSFWYANKYSASTGTIFSINGVTQRTWTTDVNWSFMEVDLEPGLNDITWEKKDGGSLSNNSYYLSLDDILIYYTE